MPTLKICLFGFPRIEYDGKPIALSRRKATGLLAYLAATGKPHSRDVLAATLWADHDDRRARNELRRVLVVLNKTPIAEWLDVDRKTIALKQDENLWVDVQQFAANCDGTPDQLETAVNLYRDRFMAGFTFKDSAAFDEWQTLQTQTLQQQVIGALEQLVKYRIAAGEIEPAVVLLQRWLELDPLYEPAYRQLMRAYAAGGQRAAALRLYANLVDMLQKELDVPPQEETTQLYETIRANEAVRLEEHEPPIFGNLPPIPPLVVGREAALNALKDRLHINPQDDQPDRRPLHVIQGWPGIGKTTISALLAHDMDTHQTFTDGVLWASLGESPNIFAELMHWANALGLEGVNTLESVEDISSRLAAVLRDQRVLLIVDDVWKAAHVMPFRVGGRHGAMLVTTRLNEVAQAIATTQADIYRLPILTEADGVALMQELAPQVVAANREAVHELVRDLEGLPLALQVSGRLLRAEMSMGWGVTDLLAELRVGARLLEAQAPADRADVQRETTPTVATLLRYSTDRLNTTMQEKFALLGVFAPKPATFDLDAMQAVWMVEDARPAARTLVDRGLLEPGSDGRFQMHALLVAHARSMFAAG
jgi:DNA-binding SARP family transcriptional activator